MLWQSSSQKQPHIVQTSQELHSALTPQKVFNPEDRYKIWKQDWALSQQNIQVSKGTISPWAGFYGQLETPSLSCPGGDRWGAPTAVAGSGCLPRAVLSVSISQAPSCPQGRGSEIVGSLTIARRAFPHRSHRSHTISLCFPVLPLMWDKIQQRLKGLR